MMWRVLAFGVAFAFACGGNSGVKGTFPVKVPGQKTWTRTTLVVKPGQRMTILAEGSIKGGELTFGPGGTKAYPQWARYSLVPEWPHLALIGKVGDDGEPFLVGKEYSGTVIRGGVLYLGVNDLDAENNDGAFEAVVVVQ